MSDPINGFAGIDPGLVSESLNSEEPINLARQALYDRIASQQPLLLIIEPEQEQKGGDSGAPEFNSDDTLLSDFHINWADDPENT